MKNAIRLVIYLFITTITPLFAQLPNCDIWLLDVKDSAGQIQLLNPVNITHHAGYDNQPSFSPDGTYLLFSSQRDSTGQTDIYKYDFQSKVTSRFTYTATSEYSPTFMPDGNNISVVMVERDSVQRLWRFPLQGGDASCIMNNIDSIGYHCWINRDNIALFMLTEPAFTLQIVNIHSQKTVLVADSIGRGIKMKNKTLWYTTKYGDFNKLFEYDLSLKQALYKGAIENEDYCFWGNSQVLSCSKNILISGYVNSKLGVIEIMNLEQLGILKPSRLCVSPDGKKMAIVSNLPN